MPTLSEVVRNIDEFERGSLKTRISDLEDSFRGADKATCDTLCSDFGISPQLLNSALLLKRIAGQVNVIVHSAGILLSLPYILEEGEAIQDLSLGAGRGSLFDLETDLRIAEFKFILWKGGAESIRQNSLFKDFYLLAEHDTSKERYLYVVGLEYPLKFLNGGRALRSVMSRNNKLWTDFQRRYGRRFSKVCEYYEYRKSLIRLVDITTVVPHFAGVTG